jgi:hypothetical protein
MLPSAAPLSVSVIMSVPNSGLNGRIGVVALRRHPDLNAVGLVGVASDEGESRIAAPQLAVDGVNHAGAGSMNSMKFNLV